MQNTAAFAVAALDDTLAAVDTFVVVENVVADTAAADSVSGIVVGSSVVAHSIAAPGIADTVAVGVYLHPCKRGPLLWTVCRSALLCSSRSPELLPLGFPDVEAPRVLLQSHLSFDAFGQTSELPCLWFQANTPSLLGCSDSFQSQEDPCPS